MRLTILWAGIAAFVLVGLFPSVLRPEWGIYPIDVSRLLRNWAIIGVITGGLFYTEPRFYPWVRAKWQMILRVIAVLAVIGLVAVWLFL